MLTQKNVNSKFKKKSLKDHRAHTVTMAGNTAGWAELGGLQRGAAQLHSVTHKDFWVSHKCLDAQE